MCGLESSASRIGIPVPDLEKEEQQQPLPISLMASLVIRVISIACLIGLAVAALSPSQQHQKKILEKWFHEFQEISATFDRDVLTQFAAEKGFHVKGTTSTTSTTTTTTTTSTTPKPKPLAVTLSSGLRGEDGMSPFFPSPSQLAFGPIRITMRTSSFPFSDPPMIDFPRGSMNQEQDADMERAFDELHKREMPNWMKLMHPEEEDDASDGTASGDRLPTMAPFKPMDEGKSGGSGNGGLPAPAPGLDSLIPIDSQQWLSELLGETSDPLPSSSSTTSTTTTTPAPLAVTSTDGPENKNWNPFSKQGFRRIFRFAF